METHHSLLDAVEEKVERETMADEQPVMRVTERGDALVLGFDRDELYDGETVTALEKAFPAAWAHDEHRIWVIDFTGVKMVVSRVIGLVLRSHQRLGERDGQVRLCGLSRDVRRVFELMGMHQLFTMYDTVEAALSGGSGD